MGVLASKNGVERCFPERVWEVLQPVVETQTPHPTLPTEVVTTVTKDGWKYTGPCELETPSNEHLQGNSYVQAHVAPEQTKAVPKDAKLLPEGAIAVAPAFWDNFRDVANDSAPPLYAMVRYIESGPEDTRLDRFRAACEAFAGTSFFDYQYYVGNQSDDQPGLISNEEVMAFMTFYYSLGNIQLDD